MSSRLAKRVAGLWVLLAGLFLVIAEVVWRNGTADPRLPHLPTVIGNAVIFLIGLLGLFLIYLGVKLIRAK